MALAVSFKTILSQSILTTCFCVAILKQQSGIFNIDITFSLTFYKQPLSVILTALCSGKVKS